MAIAPIAALVVCTFLFPAPSSAAGQPPAAAPAKPSMTVQRSSLFMGEAGWSADLQLENTPLDSVVVTEVHRSLSTTESTLRDSIAALGSTEISSSTVTSSRTPLGEVISGTGLVSVTVGSRSVPRVGVYPVVIKIVAGESVPGASVIMSTVLYLVKPPATPETSLDVAFIASGRADPMVRLDGSTEVSPPTRARFTRWSELARSDRSGTTTFAIDPEELYALDRSRNPDDAALMSTLRAALVGHSVIRSTWVPTDLESWATSGTPSDLQPQFIDGQDQVGESLGIPVDARIWFPDPSVGPRALTLLRSVGVDRIIVDGSRYDRRELPADDRGLLLSFAVGEGDDRIPAHAVDPDLTELLTDTDRDNPTAEANRFAAALAGLWLIDTNSPRGVVIDVSEVSAAILEPVLQLLGTVSTNNDSGTGTPSTSAPATNGRGAFSLVSAANLFESVESYRSNGRNDGPVVDRHVDQPPIVDVSGTSRDLRGVQRLANSHRGLSVNPDPGVEIIDRLISTSLHRDLDTDQATAFREAATARITADLSAVTAPQESVITVTSRDAVIPLTIANGLNREIAVSLRLRSPRLEFPDGARQQLRLRPGVNRVNVNVGVRTSGDLPLTVEIATPDDLEVMARSDLRIRSTTFSGIGIALSAGAILVLITWWVRTARRTGRDERAADDR